jgi:GNAT superfamily N-acetyltransferase
MITYTTAVTREELQQILDLQSGNLSANVSPGEALEQGFLSMQIDIDTLSKISGRYSHVIAKSDGRVVGYTLVMLREFRNEIPLLVPMFDEFDKLLYGGRRLAEWSYFVMGQVCVDKDYRGRGIFNGLYLHLKDRMKDDFELTVTEIATRNLRSMKAHANAGFRRLKQYVSPENESWEIVYWDWS